MNQLKKNSQNERAFLKRWSNHLKNSLDYMENNLIIFWFFSAVVVLIVILCYIGSGIEKNEEDIEEINTTETITQPFYNISILAKAAIVKDVTTGTILYAKNENEALPLASITKVMTAYASSKILDDSEATNITEYALSAEGEYAFELGDSWPIKTLRDVTLLKSANDGARALSVAAGDTLTSSNEDSSKSRAFVDEMNKISHELGIFNTSFSNPSGLDIGLEASAVGSAYDISELIQHILIQDRSILEATTKKELRTVISGDDYRYLNTNKIVGEIPNLIASKTGYTDTAGGNLAIVYDSGLNHPIIIVVLGSTKDGRFDDINKLVDATQLFLIK